MKSAFPRDDEGYDILHNGQRRTFRGTKEAAFAAARFAKSRARGDIIELVDLSVSSEASPVRSILSSDCSPVSPGTGSHQTARATLCRSMAAKMGSGGAANAGILRAGSDAAPAMMARRDVVVAI
jgi:hypothetical protein